jgi:hypothetical protein
LEGGEAAFLEALEEVAPVDLSFAQGDADPEDGAFAIGADAEGDEHGAIEHAAAMPDFFVAGIEQDVGKSGERAGAPDFQIGVETGGAVADVSGTHGGAAEFLENGGDFSCGDALDIHFGERELEGLLAADAFFESRGVELDVAADLRDGKGDVAQAGLEGLGFEAVGVAQASVGALERPGPEHVGTLGLHGLVDEDAKALGEAVGTFFIEELQHGLEELRMIEAGHVWFWFWCFRDTPTRTHMARPLPDNEGGSSPAGAAALRLATLAFAPPLPLGSWAWRRQSNLQKNFYTPSNSAAFAQS